MAHFDKNGIEDQDFYHSKRFFAEAVVLTFKKRGETKVRECLGNLFEDETIMLFPKVFAEESLCQSILSLKQEEIKYK